jgi:hypothetical protein
VLAPGGKAACVRCGHALAKQSSGSPDLPLALTVAAAILLIVCNTLPLIELHVVGRFASTTIAGGAYEMWLQGQRVTSVLVAFCAVQFAGNEPLRGQRRGHSRRDRVEFLVARRAARRCCSSRTSAPVSPVFAARCACRSSCRPTTKR